MAAIDEAIEAYKSQKSGEQLTYRACARKFNVSRTTLMRRCKGVQQSIEQQEINKQKLHPQQESLLVEYINGLVKRGLAPTREMTRHFGEDIAHEYLGDGWVTRFISRNNDHLISCWTEGMDAVRHHADSEAKYDQYFNLLYKK
ncbi:hypothetical protein EK21DRAFT_12437, partial [Setomelanomma holmii]